MKLNFTGDTAGLWEGIEILGRELGFSPDNAGMPVKVENRPGNLEVKVNHGQAVIAYHQRAHFFRGLGLLMQHIRDGEDICIVEEPQFDICGPMFDLSRNAVMRLDTLKLLMGKMAVMGLNSAMLYMEDTYEIKGEPYFGYMRGRYSHEELKAMDDFAFSLGIELIPCIQTLAHLEEFLKWDEVAGLRDTRGVLLAEGDKTYALIEKMIMAASAPFRSKRIHVGMDEANELGRGRFLNEIGYRSRFDIMTDHLNKVCGIVRKHGLEPMMWSDMFLRLASANGEDYYNHGTTIPQHIIEKTPAGIQVVYWDYYTRTADDYKVLIRKHKVFDKAPAFTGGIWIWNGMGTNYSLSLETSEAALSACKEEGIKDVFVSLWGDDGNENNVFSALLGLQYYAEHCYAKVLDKNKLEERLKYCTGIEYDSYMLLNSLDETPGCNTGNPRSSNPSKFLLWQDVLLGLFDKHVEGLKLGEHYKKLEEKIKGVRDKGSQMDFIFAVPQKLCEILSLKSEVGINAKKAYEQKDKAALKKIADEILPEISKGVMELRNIHREQWFRLNKPFGWEVLDIRYGGVCSRIDTAAERISDYLEEKIEKIEELEEERLFFSEHNRFSQEYGTGYCNHYYRIASPNVFFHVLSLY